MTAKINPIFNCIITNVPGYQAPLYLRGARMVSNMGMTPIYNGVGLLITIFSYAGALTISATSCPKIMPDIDLFVHYVEEALGELEAPWRTKMSRYTLTKTWTLPRNCC